MELFLVGGLVAALVTVMVRGWMGQRRRCWEEAGPILDRLSGWLQRPVEPPRTGDFVLVTGLVDGVPVTVRCAVQDIDGKTYVTTRITMPAQTGLLQLAREGLGAKLKQAVVGRDLQLGLPGLDAAMLIRAPDAAYALALLGSEARALLQGGLLEAGVAIGEGRLTFVHNGRPSAGGHVAAIGQAMVALAQRLVHEGSVAERLARHVASDPDALFRRRCLEELLVPRHRATAAAAAALEAAREDRSPAVRALAAEALGADGVEVAQGALAATLVPEVVVQAAQVLARHGDPGDERVAEALLDKLRRPEPEVVDAVLQACGALSIAAPLELLRPLAAVDASHTPRVARLLGDHPAAEAGPLLLTLLASGRATATRVAAARVLGRRGGKEAVEALLPHTEGLRTPTELKSAARQAISAIQARLGDVGAGRLSVIEAEGGALSQVGEAPEGALSEPDA